MWRSRNETVVTNGGTTNLVYDPHGIIHFMGKAYFSSATRGTRKVFKAYADLGFGVAEALIIGLTYPVARYKAPQRVSKD